VAIRTLCNILEQLEREHRKPAILRYKSGGKWNDISSAEFVSTVRGLAMGLLGLGIRKGDRVAIVSENRPEWSAFDHAILAIGGVVVPIYPTLHANQTRFILDNSQARLLILSTPEQLEKVTPILSSLPDIMRLVMMDRPEAMPSNALMWTDLLQQGEASMAENPGRLAEETAQVGEDDLASIIYTSGTTGEPKGAMLTHANFSSNVNATRAVVPFSHADEGLSFLPLSHVFERMLEFTFLDAGVTISYAESIETVAANITEIRPTVLASVPRLLEKVQARVMDRVHASSAPRRWIFALGLWAGRRCSLAKLEGRAEPFLARLLRPVTDKLVFAKLRQGMGGRLRILISGSAPLAREMTEFFCAAGLPVLEGYGLTETSAVVSVNTPQRTRLDTVGPVIPGVEVRIADDGEILVRGPNVMKGYFRNEEATREVLRDGWFHTGDVGHLDADGFLVITDRKKEILKTSGGKMVAPQPIENLLKCDPFISQAVLIGDRRKFISALIAPDPRRLAAYAKKKSIPYTDAYELLSDPRILELYRQCVESRMEGL
jgi:long-chain acyl-CoA synthetase